ncbi:hypothetical protein [Altibacter sp.]|mgnify:CR=1 FL=1|uniref:hypothetical protein n=1 Tax=Altibacter sp. TaxID=2024823 RepID=UPI000C986156|nr:hypothetical protein [Altibacter sp.]MAP55478.1 hypothetical protein [Altibacter sp.]
MKKTILLLLLLATLVGCKDPSEKNNASPTAIQDAPHCESQATFGDLSVCFPEISGLSECYDNPNVRAAVDQFNDSENTILGYYIEDTLCKNASTFGNVSYDNYYQIYAANMAKNYHMTADEMNQIMTMMTSGFLDKTMEAVNDSAAFSEKKIEVSQPTLIEKYKLNSRSSTLILLMNIANENEARTMGVSMTAVLVRDRLIFVTYYLDYEDDTSIDAIKKNTKLFITAFLKANNYS